MKFLTFFPYCFRTVFSIVICSILNSQRSTTTLLSTVRLSNNATRIRVRKYRCIIDKATYLVMFRDEKKTKI